MEGPSKPDESPRPHRRRRWLVLLVVAAAAVASYWVLPWLLMPDDLRRMQGAWKIVKHTEGGKEFAQVRDKRCQIVGSRFGADEEWYQVRVEPEGKKIYICQASANEYELLGFKIPLPFALTRPSECICAEYQFTDRQLVISIEGVLDVATGQVTDRPDAPHRIYLERP
jgi:hypothetical protein